MRRCNQIVGILLLILSIWVIKGSKGLVYRVEFSPGAGFFPFWLALLLILTSGVILVQATLRASTKPFVTREQFGPVLKVLWPAAGMVFLTHFLGLYLASALYMGFYMRWVGRHSWLAVIAVSIGIPVATFIVFEQWFLVQMPKGPLEAWLGY